MEPRDGLLLGFHYATRLVKRTGQARRRKLGRINKP